MQDSGIVVQSGRRESKIRTQEVCIFEHPRQGKWREKGVLLINYKSPLVPYVNKIRSNVKTNQRHGRDRTKENEGIGVKQLGKQAKCNLILKRLKDLVKLSIFGNIFSKIEKTVNSFLIFEKIFSKNENYCMPLGHTLTNSLIICMLCILLIHFLCLILDICQSRPIVFGVVRDIVMVKGFQLAQVHDHQ